MPHLRRLIPSLIALVIGGAGILAVLFAWQLPPFANSVVTTENAYVRGTVTTVAPQLSGYVAKVTAHDFDAVKKGDVLVRLDDRQYRQRLTQARAALATAKAMLVKGDQSIRSAQAALHARQAALDSAEAAVQTADSNWTRVASLKERGVISATDADQAELTRHQAESAVAAAQSQIEVSQEAVNSARVNRQSLEAGLTSAEAAVELAQIDLDNTVIRAPADGRLGQIGVRTGQYVSAGSSLLSLVGHDVWIIANFKETELYGMHPGQRAIFTVDALRGRSFSGRVGQFSPATASEFSLLAGNNATGNFTKIAQRLPIRIEIDPDQKQAERLTPGLSVSVSIDTSEDG
ncbi:hemolysin secretion protein D [Salipiger aestuarii]|uniref:Multidrug resistance efflux pump n=1 Tax=Salipiger aestuarii TaxID=568098 RepID=A0A327YCD6_9RHOB|nr:HlyD family secretion protein [Salipiger aestuarii]EIE50860.1 Secretion protein HlyD family protein precursor [Citreicella sp. 357]KAA8607913.1 hemolysin secretion protein D [Salipiger aestuarii]KAA8611183.1 hemolysin secretion protein D [Salipiger aestuarii]KAB2541935.1 hemolysin secretion protein D [Salipiger aestuarii]RAK18141.1 multidrug resistance efflux pump [Salipiger aestuarii]